MKISDWQVGLYLYGCFMLGWNLYGFFAVCKRWWNK